MYLFYELLETPQFPGGKRNTQFVGEILDVKADDSACDEKGHVDIGKVKPMIFDPGINTYHGVGRFLGRAFSIGKDVRGR